jgi:acetolactate synthase-1/2/3 large subunit
VLVSGFGTESGGGLFAVGDGPVEQIDSLSTTGLAVAGGRLARLLRSPTELYGSELLLYDARGIERYTRLDDVVDAHDVVWDGSRWVVASTSRNTIFWLSSACEVADRWVAPGEGDAWHINGLLVDDGTLYATAFGRFERHREWNEHRNDGTGMVFDVHTGDDVLTGLNCPHHPRRVDGTWLVCDSATKELLELDGDGQVTRRLELRSWPRGLAVTDRFLYVGESAMRDQPEATASVAVVSRERWSVVERFVLPCEEVYDVVVAPHELADSARRGFRTNPVRTAEQDRLALFEQAGVQGATLSTLAQPLPAGERRVAIHIQVPDELTTESWNELECRIENLGSSVFVTAPPNPVHLSYRWMQEGRVEEGVRSILPHAIVAGAAADCRLGLVAPSRPGDYELRVTLVQEEVAWFDDHDHTSGFATRVRVV